MNTPDIELRVQSLERRLNRYRSVSIVLGVALVGLAGIAANAPQTTSQEVRTHKVVVVDEKGKETGHLMTGPHGGVLTLFNTDGLPVIRAGASDKGAKIIMADPKGEQYLQLTTEDVGGEVTVSDKKGVKSFVKPSPAK